MPRDIERARDGVKTALPTATEALSEPEPEPDIADRPAEAPRPRLPAIPIDPDLLRYRHRLDQQVAALRNRRPATSLAAITTVEEPRFIWPAPAFWIASLAACACAALASWWVTSASAARIGDELAQTRHALQHEQDKAEKLGTALAAASREIEARSVALLDKATREQERDALQQAWRQAEATAAAFAQSLTQERERTQQLQQEIAALREPAPAPVPAVSAAPAAPAADTTNERPTVEMADTDLLRLMSRASLLLAQGDIGAARIVLERAAETGSAPALFALAETFDPTVLASRGTVGTQGDADRAGELYARALAGGVAEARDRLAVLGR